MILAFFSSIAGGMLAMLGASRVEQLSVGFIRVIGMIVLAITAVISVWCVRSGQFGGAAAHVAAGAASMMTALSAALVILLVPMLPGKGSLFRVVASIGALSGVAAAWLWSWGVTEGVARNWLIEALGGLGQLLGAFLIGSVTVAWLLGHAYLTATKMTIAPLRRLSTLFCIAVGLRFAYAMLCMMILWLGPQWGLENSCAMSLGGSWRILSLRVGVGCWPSECSPTWWLTASSCAARNPPRESCTLPRSSPTLAN